MDQRRFNTRFFLWTLVVCALVAGVAHWIHGRQVARHVHAFLDQAAIAKGNHQLAQAIGWLRDYLQLVPSDLDVREQYARLLAEEGTKESLTKSLEQMDRVLRNDPKRIALRWEYARRALQLHRYADSRQQLQALPTNGEVEWLLGQCDVGEEHYQEAVDHLKQALKLKTGNVAPVACRSLLAQILRQRVGNSVEADQCMDALIKEHPTCDAYLARARYREDASHWKEAKEDIKKALHLKPTDAKAWLASAQLAFRRGELDQARQQLQEALKHDAKEPMFYRSLAAVEIQAGNLSEAAKYRRKLLDPQLHGTATDVWNLADVLIDLGIIDGSQGSAKLIQRLNQAQYPAKFVNYLDAKQLCQQKKWAEARPELEQVTSQFADNPQMRIKSQWLLATCYQQLGNLDGAISSYRQALNVNPAAPDIRRALVGVLVTAGRLDEAVDTYRFLAHGLTADALAFAQLLLQRNLSLPETQRHWNELDGLLEQLHQQKPEPIEVPLLRADRLLASDSSPATMAKVRKLLTGVRDKHRKQFGLWLPLIRLAEREGNLRQASQLLMDAKAQTGDSVDWRLAVAELTVQREKKPAAAQQLGRLEQHVDHFSANDQARLLEGLAHDYAAVQDAAQVHRLLHQLMQRHPKNLLLHTRLFDLAMHAGQVSDAEDLLPVLRRLEGPDGVLWRLADAALQLFRAQRGEKALLTEAQQTIDELSRRLPNSSRVHLLQAQVADMTGQPEQAIMHYQAAVRLGEREQQVLRRLVTLLYDHKRYKDASAVLDTFPESMLVTTGLRRIAVEVALQSDHAEQAARLAPLAVSASSKNYWDQLWLGYVLAKAGHKEKAEQAIRRAVELGPKKGETHIALVAFYADTKQKDKAKAAIREAAGALSAATAPMVLAQCYELLGDSTSALEQYQKALQAQPNNAQALRALASFYLNHQGFAKAQPLFQHLLDSAVHAEATDRTWARRWLAMGLAQHPGEAALNQALNLLRANGPDSKEEFDNLRAKAVVLASRPWRRAEAIGLFEQAQHLGQLPAHEQLLLASLYEANQTRKDWRIADNILAGLNANNTNNVQALILWTRSLIDQGDLTDASGRQQMLEQLAPASFETVELKARILAARNQGAPLVAAVNSHVREHPSDLQRAARLLEELNQPEAAERLYREFAARSGPPERVLPLADFLGRQDHAQEALRLCERAWAGGNPIVVVSTALDILSHAECTAADYQRVERWLQQLVTRQGQSPLLTMALANLQILRGQQAEAAQLLRQVVAADPDSFEALNNLAWLLASSRETAPEALRLIEQAIGSEGRKADLLDTRATIHLTLGQPAEAVKDLKEALAQKPALALSFHLAQAEWAAGQQDAARQTLTRAQAQGFTPLNLPRLERAKYKQFQAEVARTTAQGPRLRN